jgi:hypothetical protein
MIAKAFTPFLGVKAFMIMEMAPTRTIYGIPPSKKDRALAGGRYFAVATFAMATA